MRWALLRGFVGDGGCEIPWESRFLLFQRQFYCKRTTKWRSFWSLPFCDKFRCGELWSKQCSCIKMEGVGNASSNTSRAGSSGIEQSECSNIKLDAIYIICSQYLFAAGYKDVRGSFVCG
ncbi:uncharacterized protein [Physcomitrium patens]|uniref:uncharacterized protein isoform X2 n=1 Tax=Physcomitrium patens TaxID=3218 RepID=UPI003CCD20D0